MGWGGQEAERRINENTEKFIKVFKDSGVTITYPDLEPFRAAMKPYYAVLDKQYGKGFTQTLINAK